MRKNKSGASDPSSLQLDVLLALYAAPRRSGDLVAAVEEMRGQDLALATFYRQLQRAGELGWVESGAGESSGRGRPEREYRITGEGSRVLRDGMQRFGRRVELARALGLMAEGP